MVLGAVLVAASFLQIPDKCQPGFGWLTPNVKSVCWAFEGIKDLEVELYKSELRINYELATIACEKGELGYIRTPRCLWKEFGGGSTPNFLQKKLCLYRRNFYWPEGVNSHSPDCYDAATLSQTWHPEIAQNLHRAVYCCRSEQFEPNNIPIKRNLTTPSLQEKEFSGYHKQKCLELVKDHWPQGYATPVTR